MPGHGEKPELRGGTGPIASTAGCPSTTTLFTASLPTSIRDTKPVPFPAPCATKANLPSGLMVNAVAGDAEGRRITCAPPMRPDTSRRAMSGWPAAVTYATVGSVGSIRMLPMICASVFPGGLAEAAPAVAIAMSINAAVNNTARFM